MQGVGNKLERLSATNKINSFLLLIVKGAFTLAIFARDFALSLNVLQNK